jgi:DNA-binding NarL/FixJ family response regulator
MPFITVIIADHVKSTRAACLCLLQHEKGIRVVGEARNELEVISAISRLKPRILLLNFNLLKKKRIPLLQVLRLKSPRTKIILITRRTPEAMLLEVLSTGVRGYLRENLITTFLPKMVRVVNQGEAWVPRKMVSKILDRLTLLAAHKE